MTVFPKTGPLRTMLLWAVGGEPTYARVLTRGRHGGQVDEGDNVRSRHASEPSN